MCTKKLRSDGDLRDADTKLNRRGSVTIMSSHGALSPSLLPSGWAGSDAAHAPTPYTLPAMIEL